MRITLITVTIAWLLFTATLRPLPVHAQDVVDVNRQQVEAYFDSVGYTVEKLLAGEVDQIPRVYIVQIPKGWAEDETVQFKKSMFYRVILPLILRANEEILDDRTRLLALKAKGGRDNWTEKDHHWIDYLASAYKVKAANGVDDAPISELLNRVDAIPVSIALGQAAYESGYGTSRFAYQGNALFGQWTWGGGQKPEAQRDGKGDYGVAAFDYPLSSAESYAANLNTHAAYAAFRSQRAELRSKDSEAPLDGYALAGALTSYSELGESYVQTLRGMIKGNHLGIADAAQLRDMPPIYFK